MKREDRQKSLTATEETKDSERLYIYLQSQREAAVNRERNRSVASQEEATGRINLDMDSFEAITHEKSTRRYTQGGVALLVGASGAEEFKALQQKHARSASLRSVDSSPGKLATKAKAAPQSLKTPKNLGARNTNSKRISTSKP